MYLSVHFATAQSSERYTSTGPPLAVAFAGVEALVVTQVCTCTSAAHWYTVYYKRSVAYRLHTAKHLLPSSVCCGLYGGSTTVFWASPFAAEVSLSLELLTLDEITTAKQRGLADEGFFFFFFRQPLCLRSFNTSRWM